MPPGRYICVIQWHIALDGVPDPTAEDNIWGVELSSVNLHLPTYDSPEDSINHCDFVSLKMTFDLLPNSMLPVASVVRLSVCMSSVTFDGFSCHLAGTLTGPMQWLTPLATSLSSLFSLPLLLFLSCSLHSFPLIYRTPKIQLGAWVVVWALPASYGAEPQPKSNMVHYGFKIGAYEI